MKEKSWVVGGMQEVEGIRDRLVSLAASFWILHNLCCGHEFNSLCVCVCVDERRSKGRRAEIPALSLIGCLAGIEQAVEVTHIYNHQSSRVQLGHHSCMHALIPPNTAYYHYLYYQYLKS